MEWVKKGLIYSTANQAPWMHSHAQCPTALVLPDKIRIFFSVRDHMGESLLTYIDVNKENPSQIIYEHNQPVLPKGRRGTFDENGIIPSYIIEKDNMIFLYYAGWSRCYNVPYKNFTGLAISRDGGNTFEKYSEAPVFTLNKFDPLSATGPCINKINNLYYCIYSTGVDWIEVDNKLEHTYILVKATSMDGIEWKSNGEVAIKPENEYMAHCKPAFFYKNGYYHLWFSKRGSHNFRKPGTTSYRLGYAVSKDFNEWTRMDENCGIDVSDSGWDSEMICYPHIVENDNHFIMFYNGNGFGKSGFGYAIMNKN